MLRVSIKDGEQLVYSESTLTDLVVDVSYVISVLYDRIKMSSPEKAEAFRRMLIQSLVDPKSPVWNYDPPSPADFPPVSQSKKRRIKS